MIKIHDLSFAYGEKQIFGGFSLEIPDGARSCIFGGSGCGKTTLLRLITGLEEPADGSIETDGVRFSAVFQEDRLLPFKTVLENITLIGAEKETALYMLAQLGIAEAADKYPSELSGGMRRRAAIARALSAEYGCLILDEPFAGLDKENIEKGIECDYDEMKAEIAKRDAQDMNREVSPLKKADDAIELDTSNMSLEEVVAHVMDLVEKKLEE